MKATVVLLFVIFSTTYGRYLQPNSYNRLHNDKQIFQSLSEFFNDLSVSDRIKRCGNLFDEGCINGSIIGAASDEDWLAHNGPGKRWANVEAFKHRKIVSRRR